MKQQEPVQEIVRTPEDNNSLRIKGIYRPVWAEISHENLRHNFMEISKEVAPKSSILSVVKANAYGHGLIPVAQTLFRCGTAFLGVASVEESLSLKKAGIQVPVLILGNIFPFENLEPAIENDIRVTVASIESAAMCDRFARKAGKKVHVHAKIDTGMNRIGVSMQNGPALIEKILAFPSIHLEGIYTHFSGSAEDPDFTRKQLHLFSKFITELSEKKVTVPYFHCANSAALLRYPESRFSMVRPGISLYGLNPVPKENEAALRPVLSWKSRIVFLKEVPPQTPISYAATFKTKRKSKIATAAFGYADGFRRALSNKGAVLVNGKRVPVAGIVTMDMTMLDVTDLPDVRVGDEVVLIGEQGQEKITVQEMAKWAGTIPYEIFCGIAARVPRIDCGL